MITLYAKNNKQYSINSILCERVYFKAGFVVNFINKCNFVEQSMKIWTVVNFILN